MIRMPLAHATVALVLLNLAACGAPSGDSWFFAANPEAALDNEPLDDFTDADYGKITLENFGYNLPFDLVTDVAARIGCERALSFLAFPESGNLDETIRQLYDTTNIYDTLQSQLWQSQTAASRCSGSKLPTPNDDAGFLAILRQVANQGNRLTIVTIGGFGSHEVPEHFLGLSARRWQAAAAAAGLQDSYDLERFECSDSYKPDDICAEEFKHFWEQLEKNSSGAARSYLMLGYSKGGSTVLRALAETQSMRDKTLALLTYAAPIAGAAATLLPNTIQKAISANSDIDLPGPGRIIDLLEQLEIPNVDDQIIKTIAGGKYQRPGVREQYLRDTLAKQNLFRSDGTSLGIFHVAATLDIAQLKRAIPLLQRGDDGIQMDLSTVKRDEAAQLITSPMFADFPIFDSTVSLEHAVIPRQFVPAGANVELLALLRVDHLSLRQDESDLADGIPHVELMDAFLQVINRRIAASSKGGK